VPGFIGELHLRRTSASPPSRGAGVASGARSPIFRDLSSLAPCLVTEDSRPPDREIRSIDFTNVYHFPVISSIQPASSWQYSGDTERKCSSVKRLRERYFVPLALKKEGSNRCWRVRNPGREPALGPRPPIQPFLFPSTSHYWPRVGEAHSAFRSDIRKSTESAQPAAPLCYKRQITCPPIMLGQPNRDHPLIRCPELTSGSDTRSLKTGEGRSNPEAHTNDMDPVKGGRSPPSETGGPHGRTGRGPALWVGRISPC